MVQSQIPDMNHTGLISGLQREAQSNGEKTGASDSADAREAQQEDFDDGFDADVDANGSNAGRDQRALLTKRVDTSDGSSGILNKFKKAMK